MNDKDLFELLPCSSCGTNAATWIALCILAGVFTALIVAILWAGQ